MTDPKDAEIERLKAARAGFAEALRVVEPLKKELAEARETVARLQETLEAYGDGGNEGPSMHAFLGDYRIIEEAIGGSYTAEAFEALTEKAKALDELEAWLRDPERVAQSALVQINQEGFYCAVEDGWATGPTIAAAIRGAIEKASGQGGK